jgi:hypothetical protein
MHKAALLLEQQKIVFLFTKNYRNVKNESYFRTTYNPEKNNSSAIKKFYILNPEMPPETPTFFTENQLFEKSEFSTLSEERVQKEFEMIRTIASQYDVEVFEKCSNLEAKQRFLFRFWKSRDPDTTTLVNEALLKHKEKINYANAFF